MEGLFDTENGTVVKDRFVKKLERKNLDCVALDKLLDGKTN
jgi:hypothetical protein